MINSGCITECLSMTLTAIIFETIYRGAISLSKQPEFEKENTRCNILKNKESIAYLSVYYLSITYLLLLKVSSDVNCVKIV